MLPQIRLQPWYPGLFGVPGSDVPRGLRWEPTAIVLYVDDNHPGATAFADGTDPENPLNSLQTAVDRLVTFQTATNTPLVGSYIVVGAGATIAESVVVGPTAPKGVTILGCSTGAYHPTWTPATATGTALTLRQENWRVSGFQFHFSGNGTGIRLELVAASGYNSSGAVIDDNHFSGWWNGLYGIDFAGAPYNVLIANNEFNELYSAGGAGLAYAICVTESAFAEPLECRVVGNMFWENENHVGSLGAVRSFNTSLFQGNVFNHGSMITSTVKLDLRSNHGEQNIVTGNVFCGTYSNAGGYYASTAGGADNWVGNVAEDEASPLVGDNGFTIAPPV